MKSPLTLKLQLPSSIEISRKFGVRRADGSNCRSLDGRRIDESDKQCKNAQS
jgi:hypothetical protein